MFYNKNKKHFLIIKGYDKPNTPYKKRVFTESLGRVLLALSRFFMSRGLQRDVCIVLFPKFERTRTFQNTRVFCVILAVVVRCYQSLIMRCFVDYLH